MAEHYRAQQALIVATLALVRREWSRMGPDFDVSWAALGRRILLLTTSAQLGAARSGAAYVPATLAELGTPVAPVGEVVPAAFTGVASDGRPLESLLGESVIKAKVARGEGAPVGEALAVGGRALDMYVHTQVADAARDAASVAIAARPRTGWVRMINAPCCSRCAILAGKWFGWNEGFQRHPFVIAGTCRLLRITLITSARTPVHCLRRVRSRAYPVARRRLSRMAPTRRRS